MIDAKKIADAVRAIREAYAPLVRTNTVCDGLTAIIYELDPPEPMPLLADAKVGDWVEIEVAGVISQQLVKLGVFADSVNAGGIEFYGNGLPVMKPMNARIIRKLDPSEVVIRIGCLEGTVNLCDNKNICPYSTVDNPCHFILQNLVTGYWSAISFKELDTLTRELVESLLKAQEEK